MKQHLTINTDITDWSTAWNAVWGTKSTANLPEGAYCHYVESLHPEANLEWSQYAPRTLRVKDDISLVSVTVSSGIWKGATAYNNPDYVFDHYYDGRCDNPEYPGLMPLDDLGLFLRKNHYLPSIKRGPSDAFDRLDMVLQATEENALYILQLQERINYLESKLNGRSS